MKILIKRAPQNWLLFWKPLNGQTWYPINYANVAFTGFTERIRSKMNQLLTGKTAEAQFEAFYCRETKTLALWS